MKAQEWTRLVLIGILSLFLAGFSGCPRWGSHVEAQPAPDPYTGAYGTLPTTLMFLATIKGQNTRTASVPVSQVPLLISQKMSNPVAFVALDLATGLGALT